MYSVSLPRAFHLADANPRVDWMRGGLGACFPRIRDDGYLEVMVGGRDESGRSRIGALVFEWGDPPRLIDISDVLLDLGELGYFDMDGCGYPWIVREHDVQRMYYVGWMKLGGDIPFRNKLGVAERRGDADIFQRLSRGGLFHATDAEPVGSGSCSVDRLPTGTWRMIYTNFEPWVRGPNGPYHRYHLRVAHSTDGLAFDRDQSQIVEALQGGEIAIGTPAPRRIGAQEEILFAARSTNYSLYAARARNGYRLGARTILRIEPGKWDDQTQAYPRILHHDGSDWLFYSGNGYGRAGFGLIRLGDRPLSVEYDD